MLSRDWDGKHYVWLSLRKIAEEADVSYSEVLEIKNALELKGYIRDMGQHGNGAFSQVRDWSIKGLLRALEYAIKCDPNTLAGKGMAERLGHPVTMADFWQYAGGPNDGKPYEPYRPFTTPKQLNEYNAARGRISGWDSYYNGCLEIPKPEKRKRREVECPDCGALFRTGSLNPLTRCLKCRKARRRLSLQKVKA
jgi:hypothetical protein